MKEKIQVRKKKDGERWSGYPYNVLDLLPARDCVFDSYHGTVGTGIFPFALNTRTFISNQVYLKLYAMAGKYRIRKLTPTECFALMGVRERERERLKGCGISDGQLYKLAGNSIVVDVLMGIFGQMFNPQPEEDRDQIAFPWW